MKEEKIKFEDLNWFLKICVIGGLIAIVSFAIGFIIGIFAPVV